MTIKIEKHPLSATASSQAPEKNGPEELDDVGVTAQFDEMVKAGKLYYDYDFVTKRRRVNGFEVSHVRPPHLKTSPR